MSVYTQRDGFITLAIGNGPIIRWGEMGLYILRNAIYGLRSRCGSEQDS